MDLIVAATNKEITPFISASLAHQNIKTLVSGAGCVETVLTLSRYLSRQTPTKISRVVHVGVAGAYCESGLRPLDVCIATNEIFADFGVAFGDTIDDLTFLGCPAKTIRMDESLLNKATQFFEKQGTKFSSGNFLTVNSVSGTALRGAFLQKKHSALCENMEGFAVARVCLEFHIPCLEVRCISNMVADRNVQSWPIDDACTKLAKSLLPFLH